MKDGKKHGNPKVLEEAKERACGGKVKRARGGSVSTGSCNTVGPKVGSPLSSANKVSGRK